MPSVLCYHGNYFLLEVQVHNLASTYCCEKTQNGGGYNNCDGTINKIDNGPKERWKDKLCQKYHTTDNSDICAKTPDLNSCLPSFSIFSGWCRVVELEFKKRHSLVSHFLEYIAFLDLLIIQSLRKIDLISYFGNYMEIDQIK